MGFEVGKPRHPNAGRKKGTPNKSSLPIEEVCRFHNCNPLEALIECMKDPEQRFNAAKELMQYLYPKRKALEVSILDIPDEEFDREVERRLNERRSPARISER